MENTRFRKWHLPVLVLLVAGTVAAIRSNNKAQGAQASWQHSEGVIFGTVYHASYRHDSNLYDEIMAELNAVDASLSMFNPGSTVSRINRNETTGADSLMMAVVGVSDKVNRETGGAFDATVAPLVNAWGFGFKQNQFPDSARIDSIMQYVGWDKISLDGNRICKELPGMVLDFSAVAKGFGVDRVAGMFRRHGIGDFMIEIGGEIAVAGRNSKGGEWRIGINSPQDDSTGTGNELQEVMEVTDTYIATSGNYRNFYVRDGRKIAHTIDPSTGYPVQHSILSSTVMAPSCALADAYATSFMVMGLDGARQFLERHPELEAYFIYDGGDGGYEVFSTPGFARYIAK